MLSDFAKVFENKVWRVQVAHLHNAARALSSPSRVFNCQQILAKISFVVFDIVIKNKSNVVLAWHWWNSTYLGLIGLLQQTITWYKIRHTGGQAHYYSRTGTLKQKAVTLDWLRSLCFNVPVREYQWACPPVWRILYHVIVCCKRPIDRFLINLEVEIVACVLSFRKSRHKPNLENNSKYGFSPDLGEKNGGALSMRMQVILDSSFRPPGFSPYMGREERRVQGLDYCFFGFVSQLFPWPFKGDWLTRSHLFLVDVGRQGYGSCHCCFLSDSGERWRTAHQTFVPSPS